MIELTRQYGRYGYCRIAALLRDAGRQVNDKLVERLWRRERLKVPMKPLKRGRLWLNDRACIRLRPGYRNQVWLNALVHHRTDDGKAFRTLNILDEHSRECLEIRVKRKLNSTEITDALTDLFILRGVPTSGLTAAQSSSPRPSEIGSRRLEQRPHTSSQNLHGRTDTAKASTGECGMNCGTVRSYSRSGRPRS